MTVLEFLFLCVLRRIPEMDDDIVAKWIIKSIWIFGSFFGTLKFIMNRRPNTNEVILSFTISIRNSQIY